MAVENGQPYRRLFRSGPAHSVPAVRGYIHVVAGTEADLGAVREFQSRSPLQ